jgi:hypothetical protein
MPEDEHQVEGGVAFVSQRERKERSRETMVRRAEGRNVSNLFGVSLLWVL